MDDSDARLEQTAPVWAAFGDLMSGLLGAFGQPDGTVARLLGAAQ